MRGQVDAAVYGVVVLVGGGGRGGPQALLVLIHVRVIYERDVVGVVIDQEFGRCHEVMDGSLGFRFLQAFVERATECFHHSDLEREVEGQGPEGGGEGIVEGGREGARREGRKEERK